MSSKLPIGSKIRWVWQETHVYYNTVFIIQSYYDDDRITAISEDGLHTIRGYHILRGWFEVVNKANPLSYKPEEIIL